MASYPQEAQLLEECYAFLTEALASPSSIKAPPPTKAHLETIEAILERWPAHARFPGAYLMAPFALLDRESSLDT